MNWTDHLSFASKSSISLPASPDESWWSVSLSFRFYIKCYINRHTWDKHFSGIMYIVHSSLKPDMIVINNFLRQPQALSALLSETFLLGTVTPIRHSHEEGAVWVAINNISKEGYQSRWKLISWIQRHLWMVHKWFHLWMFHH